MGITTTILALLGVVAALGWSRKFYAWMHPVDPAAKQRQDAAAAKLNEAITRGESGKPPS